MYYYLLSSMKRRLIVELQDSFSRHPIYAKIVPFIQDKYSFEERPHFGIVIKGASANKVVLAADNFVGTIHSRTMLSYVGPPSYPLEWVREDLAVVQQNGDVMPTVPGIYFLEVLEAPDTPQTPGSYIIDPLYTVTDEPVLRFVSGVERAAQLRHAPAPRTLRLWLNQRVLMQQGRDYVVDGKGAITFQTAFPGGTTVTADYRYPGDSIGPQAFYWNTSDALTLPGVVLAFGKRARKGDKVAVSVYQDRVQAAMAYGGKYELSFDVDVIATDPTQMEEIADFAVMTLTAEKKPVLEFEGIELLDISIGGTAEESYDETGDLFFYTASLGIQFRADWEVHIPLPLTFSKVTGERQDGTQGIEGALHLGLTSATAPVLPSRNHSYERIK